MAPSVISPQLDPSLSSSAARSAGGSALSSWSRASIAASRRERSGAKRAQPRMQRLDHGMGKRLARSDPVQGIAPPLQAHEPGHRLADDAPHASDLVIECIEHEQRLARIGGREQGREIAVRIMLADLDGGMGEYGGDGSPPRTLLETYQSVATS